MRNYFKCKQAIESSITSSAEHLAAKYSLDVDTFLNWKNKIIELVEKRIKILKMRKVPSATKPVLQEQE